MAFCVNAALMYIPYYLAGFYANPIAISVCVFPILAVILSKVLGIFIKELHFNWTFDYDFQTLKYNPQYPDFENWKRVQSNPDDRKPKSA